MLYDRLGVIALEDLIMEVHKRTGESLTLSKIEMLRGKGVLLVGVIYEGYFAVLPKNIPIKDAKTNRLYSSWELHESEEDLDFQYEEVKEFSLLEHEEFFQFCSENIVIPLTIYERLLDWLDPSDIMEEGENAVSNTPTDELKPQVRNNLLKVIGGLTHIVVSHYPNACTLKNGDNISHKKITELVNDQLNRLGVDIHGTGRDGEVIKEALALLNEKSK